MEGELLTDARRLGMVSDMHDVRFSHLRPMDFGEILDHSIRVMKTGWKPLLLSGLISIIPMVISSGLLTAMSPTTAATRSSLTTNWLFRAILQADQGNFTDLLELGGIFTVLMLVSVLLGLWLHAAMIVSASRTYLGLPVTFRSSLAAAGHRYPALLGTGLLMLLFAVLASIGLAVVGLGFFSVFTMLFGLGVLKVYTVFVNHALIIEDADGGMAPIKRSFRLVNGRFWPLLGLGIVFSLFSSALSSQIQFITQLPLQWLMTFGFTPGAVPLLGWLLACLMGLITAVISPLTYTAMTLAYYDTRIRKEGLDLEMMASAGAEPR
jgi:hypothetical protein